MNGVILAGGVILGCYEDATVGGYGNEDLYPAMRNVPCGCGCGIIILGCYEDATVRYGNEDLYLVAMRNVTCDCGDGVIGCYEDATVRYGNDLYHNDWFCGGGVILIADCYEDGATVIVLWE